MGYLSERGFLLLSTKRREAEKEKRITDGLILAKGVRQRCGVLAGERTRNIKRIEGAICPTSQQNNGGIGMGCESEEKARK